MTNDNIPKRHLLWLSDSGLDQILHAATWLRTTQEMRNMGWDVTLVTPGFSGEKEIDGVKVVGISEPSIYFIRQIIYHLRVYRFIYQLKKPIDFILFHPNTAIWMAIPRLINIVFNGKNRPYYVIDTRSLPMIPEDKMKLKDRIRFLYQESVDKWGHLWVDGRLVITKRIAQVIGIPENKVWGVWSSGVEREKFLEAAVKRQFPKGDSPVEIIYIGSLDYERNLMNMSKAVLRANEEGMNFGLTLVGEGSEKQDLEVLARQSNGIIQVQGRVKQSEIPSWLAKAHIGVLAFPNEVKFQVSSPIKLFEYMASGLPIMATRIACHTDVIGEGKYVFWAEDSNIEGLLQALRNIWQGRVKLEEMSKMATQASLNWTWKKSAEAIMEALEGGRRKALEKKE